jgi:hypothetical protein
MPVQLHCLRDATYWRLPRKRLARVLGRRIQAEDPLLAQLQVAWFVDSHLRRAD